MSPGGMFKVVLWLAPVLALLFFYISQKQDAQVDDMKADFAKFDEDFARMSEGLSTGQEKVEWADAKAEAHSRKEAAQKRAQSSKQKEDETFAAMEKELRNTNADDLIKKGE